MVDKNRVLVQQCLDDDAVSAAPICMGYIMYYGRRRPEFD